MIQDLRFGLRMMARAPGFAVIALLTIALGVGATVAVFSVVNAVMLKPVGYPDADRVVLFSTNTPGGRDDIASAAVFNLWRRQTGMFEEMACIDIPGATYAVTGGSQIEKLRGRRVTTGYFSIFGAPLLLGRSFLSEETRPNGGDVVVLSRRFWMRRFGGDPQIVGNTLDLNGAPHTIVGVLGSDFDGELEPAPEIWLPFQLQESSNDHSRVFQVVARLKPDVTPGMASAMLGGATESYRRTFPGRMGPGMVFSVVLYKDTLVLPETQRSLLLLAGAVGFVLLIACVNVANLLLVRASARRREMAVRSALGASPRQLIRQLLTESLVLSLLGGSLGLFLGFGGARLLLTLAPGDLPRIGVGGAAVSLDWRVVVFTVSLSILTSVLFGLAPALTLSRTDLASNLKEGGKKRGETFRQFTARSVLVISEIALALILLVGAGLLIRSFFALRSVNPGFDGRDVITMRMSLAGSRYASPAEVNQLVREGVERIETLPGIIRAAAGYTHPLVGNFGIPFNIVGRTPVSGLVDGRGWSAASPGYFALFKIPILRGREFGDQDSPTTERVAVINETLARQFWPHGDPVGEYLVLGKNYGPGFEEPARRIIGVVGDVHESGFNLPPSPVVYVPLAQVNEHISGLLGRAGGLVWAVRGRSKTESFPVAIEKELNDVSRGLPLTAIRWMDQLASQSTAQSDFNTLLLMIFGLSALALAAIGIYGAISYSVAERTHEIGVRMALGAQAADVLRLVLRQGLNLLLIGLLLGITGAVWLTQMISGWLFGVSPNDPATFAGVLFLLAAAAMLACYIPARRATTVDPLIALRRE